MMRAEADGATMLELPESTLPLFDFDQATYCTGPAARPSAPNRLFPRDLNLGVNQTHDDATRDARPLASRQRGSGGSVYNTSFAYPDVAVLLKLRKGAHSRSPRRQKKQHGRGSSSRHK